MAARAQALFPTLVYQAPLKPSAASLRALNAELLREAHQLRDHDRAGRQWSAKNYPGGYTSYGSMDQLHRFSSTFMDLRQALDRHVRAYAKALHWDLAGQRLAMTDCWLNVMPKSTAHGLHLHPNSVVSGTYYVAVPRGASGLKFEDPRLGFLMAAPQRRPDAPEAVQPFVTRKAKAGDVILFESWLRHEVAANPVVAERVSISFNYATVPIVRED